MPHGWLYNKTPIQGLILISRLHKAMSRQGFEGVLFESVHRVV